MEYAFPLENFRRENWVTFSKLPLFPGIFQWNARKTCLLLASQPEFLDKWKAPLPWVPEVFLACGGKFRCWPKADTFSAFRAGHYKDLTETGNRARKVSGTQGKAPRDSTVELFPQLHWLSLASLRSHGIYANTVSRRHIRSKGNRTLLNTGT